MSLNSFNFLSNSKFMYVAINICLGIVGFIKSFVFMSFYNFTELGFITLLNTSIMLVSLLQFGLINGGYRIYSIGDMSQAEDVNNTINTYFLLLLFLLILILGFLFFFEYEINTLYLIVGGFTGIAALSQNWLTNILIAKSELKKLNNLNIAYAVISVLLLILVPFYKLTGGVLAIAIPPFIFVIVTFSFYKNLLPSSISLKKSHIKLILISGFIPFLSGIFDQVNLQIQNWSINVVLSEEYLGKFYLVSLYIVVFMLIPKSINSLFFPQAMRYYNKGLFKELKTHINKYYFYLFLYVIPVISSTVLFLEPIVIWIFPNHIIGIKYVYIVLPGLTALLFSSPIGLIYNASLKLYPMLYAYVLSSLINIIFVYVFWKESIFNLENMAILKSGLGVFILIFYIVSYKIVENKIWKKI